MPRLRLPFAALAGLALLGAGGTLVLRPLLRDAAAQDDEQDARAAKSIEEDLARLRNPFFSGLPDRVQQIVQSLLAQDSRRADEGLRDILRDTTAHPAVVEQIVIATWIEPRHRLLPEVVERLKTDSDTELDRRLEVPLLKYGDADTVRVLADLARDPSRTTAYRATAVRTLGRNGDPLALPFLAELWGGPEKELRSAAALAFERIYPVGCRSAEEAALLAEQIRREELPFAEVLRRRLRDQRERTLPRAADEGEEGELARHYRLLAEKSLPLAPLDQVLELYVGGSPDPAVRAAGARRVAEFPFDSARDPEAKLRAGRALFAQLRREGSEEVELELLRALAAVASDLRRNVSADEMAALEARVAMDPRVPRDVRLAAVAVVGELRDPRPVPVLQDAYLALDDTDPEARLAILEALDKIPGDYTGWLIARLAFEPHTLVVRKLVVLLNRADDPAAISAFRELLKSHPDQKVRWDVAKALGTLWAGRHVEAARDALATYGLRDADPTVRSTTVAALGYRAPGASPDDVQATIELMRQRLAQDPDARVRRDAAKSVVDLDEAGAAKHLLPYFHDDLGDGPARSRFSPTEVWNFYRDHLVDALKRREKTPERVLMTADLLERNDLRRYAEDLLRHAITAREGLFESESGRGRVRERLAGILLAEGNPAEAESLALQLVASDVRDDAALVRWDFLLARAQTAQNHPEKLKDARRRLESLSTDPRLPPVLGPEVQIELGHCLLRLRDPLAALAALEKPVGTGDLPPETARRLSLLLEEARRKVEEDRAKLRTALDGLGQPDPKPARDALERLPGAATHLLQMLDGVARDPAALRRVVAAAEIVCGRSFRAPGEAPSPADLDAIVGELRTGLARTASRSGSGER